MATDILALIQCIFLLIPFRVYGAFVITMYRMLLDDMLKFLVVWLVLGLSVSIRISISISISIY